MFVLAPEFGKFNNMLALHTSIHSDTHNHTTDIYADAHTGTHSLPVPLSYPTAPKNVLFMINR